MVVVFELPDSVVLPTTVLQVAVLLMGAFVPGLTVAVKLNVPLLRPELLVQVNVPEPIVPHVQPAGGALIAAIVMGACNTSVIVVRPIVGPPLLLRTSW